MTPRTHLLWPVLIALTAGACARQQPAYYVDSVTGQPVAMAQTPQPAPQQTAALDGSSTPLDAATEQERIAKLTGNKPVIIERQGNTKIKLPGL